jgi:hypothetical protein
MNGFMGLFLAVSLAGADDWSIKAIKSVGVVIEPAEASPGQVVTVKLTVSLADTYHTYPLVQPDKKAADQVNTLEFPKGDLAGLIFVGTTKDPANPTKKAEPVLGIREMHLFSGTVTYERKAIVSPKATTGEQKLTLPKFVLSVCDDSICYPAKTYQPEVTWKVKDGPAVEIPMEYKDEVEKVLKNK